MASSPWSGPSLSTPSSRSRISARPPMAGSAGSSLSRPEYGGTELPRPRNSPLGQLIPEVTAFLNADRGPLPTWRFALGGTAEIVTRQRSPTPGVHVRLAREPRRGRVREHRRCPGGHRGRAGVHHRLPAGQRPWQAAAVAHRPLHGLARQGLEERGLGPFAAAWVTDVALAVAADAVLRGDGIESLSGLEPSQWQSLAETVVDGVLLATTHSEIDETPLRETVLDALRDSGMIQVLRRDHPGAQPGTRSGLAAVDPVPVPADPGGGLASSGSAGLPGLQRGLRRAGRCHRRGRPARPHRHVRHRSRRRRAGRGPDPPPGG